MRLNNKYIIFIVLLFCAFVHAKAQTFRTIVQGTVIDASTKETLPNVSIILSNKHQGTVSDIDGKFLLRTTDSCSFINVSFIGYKPEKRKIKIGQNNTITIELSSEDKSLNEVVVKPPKKRYRNKGNPAVELIDSVIKYKPKSRYEGFDYLEFEKYDKIMFALSNVSDKFRQKKVFKKFQFVFDNMDTVKMSGQRILPIYIKESLSDFYFKKPNSVKEIVTANKMVSFDGYLDDQGLMEYFKYLYQDINIYDNNIALLSNQFLSPIANSAPTFYKYYIIDTVEIDSQKCIQLAFFPRNKTDMLFQGNLYILLDGSYAVRRVNMNVNKNINLNWVKDLKIDQEYENIQHQGWMLSTDQIGIDFGLSDNGMGIFGERQVSYRNHRFNEQRPDSLFTGLEKVTLDSANKHNDAFWAAHRHSELTKSELGTYAVIDSVKRLPAFKRTMDILFLLLAGYKDMGYFEIGPVNTFYSYNPIEGVRLRFGGRTTPKLSKRFTFETYGAYGFRDEKPKYYFGTTISLTPRTIWQFPVKSVKVSYQDETKIPGQELQFIQEDNILLSIKRGVNDKLFYNKTLTIEHLNEFPSHFSYTIGYQYLRQTPAGNLYFNSESFLLHTNEVPHINVSEPYIVLRYAPHEQFYQVKNYRVPMTNQYPVLQLQCNFGNKLWGNDFNYQTLRFTLSKRFYLSVLGYTDMIWESGKVFGRVSYPLLSIHRANQTYSYQITSYNLMNFLEFVSDEYTSLNVDHCFNGFFFNKIPLFKKLKFREVATCKILYGRVSDNNNPNLHSDLFKYPVDLQGNPITYTLEKEPYVEASVGISNIFKFFRVDFVKRFTYLDHANTSDWGIRARFKMDF